MSPPEAHLQKANPSFSKPKNRLKRNQGLGNPRPQFSKFSQAIESAVLHIYQNTADTMARLDFENFRYTPEGDFFLSK